MKKRALSLLLCLCMALTLFPAVPARADDTVPEPVEEFGTKEEIFDALGLPVDEDAMREQLDAAISPYGEGTVVTGAVSELYLTRNYSDDFDEWETRERPDFQGDSRDRILGSLLRGSGRKNLFGTEMLYAISEELSFFRDGKVNIVAELLLYKIDGVYSDEANTVEDAFMTVNLYYLDAEGDRKPLTLKDGETPVRMTLSVKDENKVQDGNEADGWENNGWEYDALMEMVSGDFDGDSREELAIYDPADACIRFFDLALVDTDGDQEPDSFSLTEMEAAAVPVPRQAYVSQYDYTDAGERIGQHDGYQLLYPTVSLAAVDFARDYQDELAMAVSPNFYRKLVGYGNGSALLVYDTNGDLSSAPTRAYEQRLEWTAADGYSIGDDETIAMRYVGVAVGDLDGDSGTELIAAGYNVFTDWNDGYGTDCDIMYTILGYDDSRQEVVSEMDGAAGAVYNTNGDFSYLADENNESCGDRREHSYVPPMKVAAARTRGPNAAAQVFMGDTLFDWDPDVRAEQVDVRGFGPDNTAVLRGKMTAVSGADSFDWGSPWKCQYITDVAVGNFNGNVFGYEQLVFGVIHKDGRGVDAGSEFWYYSFCYNGSGYSRPRYQDDATSDALRSGAVLAVNPDSEDSTFLRPVSRELRYSEATVLAVLQAAPYFEDLTVLDPINYQSGGTSFGVSAGAGTEASMGVEQSISVGVEFEQGIEFFGIKLFDAGCSMGGEFGVSHEFSASFETSVGISYETGSEDSVVVCTVPQFVYNYEMWVPASTVPTGSAYTAWIAQRVEQLIRNNYDTDRTDGEGLTDEEIAELRAELTTAMKEEYSPGDPIVAHWEPFSVVAPLEMINTVMPVETYDEVAERCGLQRIRGSVLNNTVGDPSSYTYRPFFFNPVYSGVAIGDSSITKEYESSVGVGYTIGFSESISTEAKVGLVGFDLVLGSTTTASQSAGISVSTGTGFSGSVINMPEGSEGYGFSWTFGYQLYTINGIPVPVLQYHVTNVQEPPSLPVNLQVDGSTEDSITISWEPGRKFAKTYEIYLYDEIYDRSYLIATVDGDTTTFTHTGLNPSSTYSYRLAAVRDATSTSILSQVVTGRTTPAGADAPHFTVQPEDASAYPGKQVTFTAEAVSGDAGAIYYQWQRRVDGVWKDLNGARSSSYTLMGTLENRGSGYRCRAYQITSGGVAEAFSDEATLAVAKMTPALAITENGNTTTNIMLTLQSTLNGVADAPAPTGGVSYEVLCLSGSGASATLTAEYNSETGKHSADWTPAEPGLYRVTAAYSGDARYRSATDSFELYVTEEGSPVLTLTAKNMTYGETQTFAARLDGVAVDAAYTVDGATVAKGSFTPTAAGNYTVTADCTVDGNAYTVRASFTVDPAVITVEADDRSVEFGSYEAVSCTLRGIDDPADIADAFTVTAVESYKNDGTPKKMVGSDTPVGSYPVVVRATEAADALGDKYSIVLQNGTYTVTPTTYRGTLTYGKTGNGTVSGTADSGTVISSTTPVTLTAAPAPGNRVARWSVAVNGGTPVVTEGDVRSFTYTLTENADVAVTVDFVEDYYNVTFGADPAQGTVSAKTDGTTLHSGGDVPARRQVTFTAKAVEGFEFLGWRLNDGTAYFSTQEACSLTVTADTAMVAEFRAEATATYTVTASVSGSGSVTPDGEQTVREGDGLSFTATPASDNYVFIGWTVTGLGDADYDAAANPLVLTGVTADGTVSANFMSKIRYAVSYGETVSGATANGTAFASGTKQETGSMLVFTAAVPDGKYVQSWAVNGVTCSGQKGNTLSLLLSAPITDVTVTFTDTRPSGGGGEAPVVPENTVIIVDGTEYRIGTETVTDDGITATADQEQLAERIGAAKERSSVIFPITENACVSADLVLGNIGQMAAKNMTLSVSGGGVRYELPAVALDTGALMAALGATDPALVPVTVTIKKLANSAVTLNNGELVLPPVSFTVVAAYGGRRVEVEAFEQYVQRIIEIPEGIDAGKITTAVVVENGGQRHVPTEVFEQGGTWYARINSLTDSVYALIHNEVVFADAEGKWFEAVVTEMGSRGIINGRDTGVFDGEAHITRAEFAALLVRALGLPENGDPSAFTDVDESAWYFGAVGKAYEYGLADGRGDGIFDPTANITRQEAMAMVHRAAAVTGLAGTSGTLDAFSDADSVSAWALADAQWNVGSGLIQGSNGMINGQNNISRAETAAILLRLLQKSALVDVRTTA